MKIEMLKKGWVEFRRVHFKEGYVDRWSGDVADDPNNESKSRRNLNSFVTYYRCNGSKWIIDRRASREFHALNKKTTKELTAHEWFQNMLLKK